MKLERTKRARKNKHTTSLLQKPVWSQAHVTARLSTVEARKQRRRYLNRLSAHRVNRRLADEYSSLQQRVDVAQQELFENLYRLAELQADACALRRAIQYYSQLHNNVCAENARLCQQEAVLRAELQSCEMVEVITDDSKTPIATAAAGTTGEVLHSTAVDCSGTLM